MFHNPQRLWSTLIWGLKPTVIAWYTKTFVQKNERDFVVEGVVPCSGTELKIYNNVRQERPFLTEINRILVPRSANIKTHVSFLLTWSIEHRLTIQKGAIILLGSTMSYTSVRSCCPIRLGTTQVQDWPFSKKNTHNGLHSARAGLVRNDRETDYTWSLTSSPFSSLLLHENNSRLHVI